MLGKTHMMVGIAATLVAIRPDTLPGIVTAAGAGAVGSLISDIDVGTSSSHRDANKIIFLTVLVAAAVLVADYFGKLGLMQNIMQNNNIIRIILGVLLFIVICMLGQKTPHRSFMHSLTALIMLDAAIYLIYPPIVLCFTIGFLSHIATDIFNKRKIRILYPLRYGVSLNLFHAHGPANTLLFYVGSIVTVIEVILLLVNIFVK